MLVNIRLRSIMGKFYYSNCLAKVMPEWDIKQCIIKRSHLNTRKLLIKQGKSNVPEKADVMYSVLSEIRCITYAIALPCRIYI